MTNAVGNNNAPITPIPVCTSAVNAKVVPKQRREPDKATRIRKSFIDNLVFDSNEEIII